MILSNDQSLQCYSSQYYFLIRPCNVIRLNIIFLSVLAMLFVLILFSYSSLQCYSSACYFLIRPCNVIRLNIIFLSVLAMLFVCMLFSYPSLQYHWICLNITFLSVLAILLNPSQYYFIISPCNIIESVSI